MLSACVSSAGSPDVLSKITACVYCYDCYTYVMVTADKLRASCCVDVTCDSYIGEFYNKNRMSHRKNGNVAKMNLRILLFKGEGDDVVYIDDKYHMYYGGNEYIETHESIDNIYRIVGEHVNAARERDLSMPCRGYKKNYNLSKGKKIKE